LRRYGNKILRALELETCGAGGFLSLVEGTFYAWAITSGLAQLSKMDVEVKYPPLLYLSTQSLRIIGVKSGLEV
jgi:hypothetical protein